MSKEIMFGVYSKYASVYNAFIIECEKIGWVWNEFFAKKSQIDSYLNNGNSNRCIWFSTHFKAYSDTPAFSFSSGSNLMCLDTDFEGAIQKVKESFELIKPKKQALRMRLTPDFNVNIDNDEIVVGCQHISFEKFDELALLVKKYRES